MKDPEPVTRADIDAAEAAEALAAEQTLEAAREAFEAVKAARELPPDLPA